MSIGSRIKELRIKHNITQEELAKKIGVTKGAIANYENGISSPKIDLMYKLFDALDCDANYLHQDDMKQSTYRNTCTPEEFENIIKKYRILDAHGQDMVDTVLDKEYTRCTSSEKIHPFPDQVLNAANDKGATEEQKANADSIMTDDSEWE